MLTKYHSTNRINKKNALHKSSKFNLYNKNKLKGDNNYDKKLNDKKDNKKSKRMVKSSLIHEFNVMSRNRHSINDLNEFYLYENDVEIGDDADDYEYYKYDKIYSINLLPHHQRNGSILPVGIKCCNKMCDDNIFIQNEYDLNVNFTDFYGNDIYQCIVNDQEIKINGYESNEIIEIFGRKRRIFCHLCTNTMKKMYGIKCCAHDCNQYILINNEYDFENNIDYKGQLIYKYIPLSQFATRFKEETVNIYDKDYRIFCGFCTANKLNKCGDRKCVREAGEKYYSVIFRKCNNYEFSGTGFCGNHPKCSHCKGRMHDNTKSVFCTNCDRFFCNSGCMGSKSCGLCKHTFCGDCSKKHVDDICEHCCPTTEKKLLIESIGYAVNKCINNALFGIDCMNIIADYFNGYMYKIKCYAQTKGYCDKYVIIKNKQEFEQNIDYVERKIYKHIALWNKENTVNIAGNDYMVYCWKCTRYSLEICEMYDRHNGHNNGCKKMRMFWSRSCGDHPKCTHCNKPYFVDESSKLNKCERCDGIACNSCYISQNQMIKICENDPVCSICHESSGKDVSECYCDRFHCWKCTIFCKEYLYIYNDIMYDFNYNESGEEDNRKLNEYICKKWKNKHKKYDIKKKKMKKKMKKIRKAKKRNSFNSLIYSNKHSMIDA